MTTHQELLLYILIGQGYDGAASMAGRLNGVQAHVQKQYPHAIYVHCASHTLNLVLSSGCSVSAIRNAQATVGEIVKFTHASAMRTAMLTKAIGESAVQTKRKRLVSPRHAGLNAMKQSVVLWNCLNQLFDF